jgi:hypothetical protein
MISGSWSWYYQSGESEGTMKINLRIAVASLAIAAPAAHAASWPLGTEREVDEGVYMQVVAVGQGWRIWRTETRSGVSCSAVKSAKGRPHPEPVGVQSMFWNGTPFVEMSWINYGSEPRWYHQWRTTHYGRVEVKYRKPGDRFFGESFNEEINAGKFGEDQLEVVLTSWEYPAILVGLAEERAIFDLAGLQWARDQVSKCEGREPAA